MFACKIAVLLRYGVLKWMTNKKYRLHRAKREWKHSIITSTPIDNRLMWRCPMNIHKRKKMNRLYFIVIIMICMILTFSLCRAFATQKLVSYCEYHTFRMNDERLHHLLCHMISMTEPSIYLFGFFLFNNQCNVLHTCARTDLMTSIDDYLFQ